MIDKLPLAEKTNIKNWAFEDLVLKDALGMTPHTALYEANIHTTQNQIILIDGKLIHTQVPEGVIVDAEVLENPVPTTNELIALNQQKVNSKLKIIVSKNLLIRETISVVVIAKERSLIHQTEVVLETGASINLIENYKCNYQFNANIVSTFKIGANAKLKVNTLSDMADSAVVYHHKYAEVANDGTLDTTNFMINDTDLVFEDFTYLTGRGGQASVKTVSIASGKQQQNITVRTENTTDHTTADIVNYGIVKDDAHLAFNGIGKIRKDAKTSDNQQETRLLNLSTTAQAIANPFLLIDEGDITAGHAASIGQLDEEQIYYLMSRGMSRQAAGKMIVSGFLAPFIDAIEDDVMREALASRIEAKLG